MEPNGEIEERRKYSEGILKKFRRELKREALPTGYVVVINGSFARREASSQSDVDYFILHEPTSTSPKELEAVKEAVHKTITKSSLKPPAPNGAFAKPESIDEFLQNVGGAKDPNEKL